MKKQRYILIISLVFLFFILTTKSNGATLLKGIENFPESYKPYLNELKRKYPNWEFTALYTGLDWNTVISKEYANDSNLVPLSYSDEWKCTIPGIYNVEIDSGWVNASKSAIEYAMDTRNFLNEVRIFQFEKQTYDESVNTKEGIEKILYGTEFYKRNVEYYTSDGTKITMDEKYSDLIWNTAVYSGVSPYNLATRIKQEVGPFITHSSISGRVPGFEGLYNFYNIGATSSTEDLGAIKNGLRYARDGHNASEETKANYLIPWNTPEKAIKGGAVFIGKSYISIGQYNLYLQKFDVNNQYKEDLYWHQYMTNCLAPYSECSSIYKAYNTSGMLNSSLAFVIPIYENMPEEICTRPDILASDYEKDNTKVYANVSTVLNVRVGPSTSYEILITVSSNEVMTRIAKGIQNGERWDKVKLQNGMVGYVFQSYIEEYNEEIPPEEEPPEETPPEEVPPEETLPEETPPEEVPPEETLPEETPPEEIPPEIILPEGIYLKFNESLKIQNKVISGLDINKLLVTDIKQLIDTNLIIEIYNYKNELLDDNKNIGTGSKLILKDENGETIYDYVFILYGDVNGDGNINSLDNLIIQKHILELRLITDKSFLQASNISKNGEEPTSLDILKIQKHILEIKLIEQ